MIPSHHAMRRATTLDIADRSVQSNYAIHLSIQ